MAYRFVVKGGGSDACVATRDLPYGRRRSYLKLFVDANYRK